METDSDYEEQYSDSEELSDASMDSGDDDDYFDTTADTQQRKVSSDDSSNYPNLLLLHGSKAPTHTALFTPHADKVRGLDAGRY